MKLLRKFWKSVKRNPVVNIFVLTAVGEISHDYLEGTIDWDNISVYATTVVMGVLARMFVVPLSEHVELENKHEVLLANYEGAVRVLQEKGDKID